MIPSIWTLYVAAVSAVTRESSRFILYHMSYARGLQYQAIWWKFMYDPRIGVSCFKPSSRIKRKVII